MEGQLFLHVGPPKTATTSLQTAFERLSHPRYSYGGVFQPREKNAGSLAQQLHRAVMEDAPVLPADFDALKERLAQGEVVLISEEMLSLRQGSVATGEKLTRLARLFGGLPVTVLATLRDPVEALPSLFQELRPGLPLDQQLDFRRFCADGVCDCFNYPRLAEGLRDVGFSDARWLDFSAIAAGRLTTAYVFGEYDLWNGAALDIGRHNAGATTNAGRRLDRVSLRGLGRVPLVRAAIDGLGLRGTALVRWSAALSERVRIGPSGYRELTVPPDRAKKLREGYNSLLRQSRSSDQGG